MSSGMVIELWFDNEAEEAANFYVEVFKDASLGAITRYNTDTPSHMPVGSVLTVDFTLNGQRFQGLNGGPDFKFTEAISFVIECEDQTEVDYYWEKLSAVPESEACGWVKDKYGVSWQIIPNGLNEVLYQEDSDKAKKAMDAMLQMKKLDIEQIRQASES